MPGATPWRGPLTRQLTRTIDANMGRITAVNMLSNVHIDVARE